MYLHELEYTVSKLPGVGKAVSSQLKNLGILTLADLLMHYPRSYENRTEKVPLSAVYKEPEGLWVNTAVTVILHDYFYVKGKQTLKIHVEDDTSGAVLICFNRRFLSGRLLPGQRYFIYGFFQVRYGEIQSSRFETADFSENPGDFNAILPLYPLSGSLNQGNMRKFVKTALSLYTANLSQELPDSLTGRYGFPDKREALQQVHFPSTPGQRETAEQYLIYEELFYLQLMIRRRSLKRASLTRVRKPMPETLQLRLKERLPFRLTEDQDRALGEIVGDLSSPVPMMRLLQGDVGCGKTLVAFLAVAACVEAGYQAAIMAPTELLARQHADTAAKILSPLGIRLALLTGNVNPENRRALRGSLAGGSIDLVIGTHALFSIDVSYKNLGLVVVDEQHKFGVLQRLALLSKGDMPDMLLMTATPIPRTVALTVFGDMDISTIKTMPPGRKPVITHLAREGNEAKVFSFIRRELAKGRQAYFVYPLIDQSGKLNLKDAESMYRELAAGPFKGLSLGLIHSRVSEDEKKEVMDGFVQGRIRILVATSVVEVGVDVPNATCLVVEHAERFGLSDLHQLRGRVGRGLEQSYAFFVYSGDFTEDAKERLLALKETGDGFLIAEKDLTIRGPGELTGVKQSGYARLTIADLARDFSVMLKARQDVTALLEKDPGLIRPENTAVREILAKKVDNFERYLDSG